ncbi:uncharacterized protein EMPS_05035 [Entomortierella parvispora]|uniref:HCP-like protein n=1 Tax=Entomortierella parvispora TaxID=205924 RepID=A0A9P3HAE4_9FUNG|nr:uncharacterized protein EMPS_05035 [Entomortierella parvispora]
MTFSSENTGPVGQQSGLANKPIGLSASVARDLAIEDLSISEPSPVPLPPIPQRPQSSPLQPPSIQQQPQHSDARPPALQPRPSRVQEWDLYEPHQHRSQAVQQSEQMHIQPQQHSYPQPPTLSQLDPSQQSFHPYSPRAEVPLPPMVLNKTGASSSKPKVMTTITATIADNNHSSSSEGRSLSFEEARVQHKKRTSQQLSPAVAARVLTPAQQREAEADAYIQRAIELHEDNQLEEATYYFRLAAQSENPVGQLMYGLSLRHGWGCKANPKEALFYLQGAAEYAMSELKELNPSNSANVRIIQQRSLRYQQKPAAPAPATAPATTQDHLHVQPLSPTYPPPSPTHGTFALKRMSTVARKSATVTARKELVLALYELGMSFLKGWGVARDRVIAFNYFKLAADLGDPDSQNEVAQCFLDGTGTEKNNFEAARYFRLASAQGASQLGNSWIFKPKYDQYCENYAANEAAESEARNQGLSQSGGPLSPSSPIGAGSMSSIAMGIASATAGVVAPSTHMASSLPSKWMSTFGHHSRHHQNQSQGQNVTPVLAGNMSKPGKTEGKATRSYNLAGDLISSSQLELKVRQAEQLTHLTVLPVLSGQQQQQQPEKKKHRWSLFPHSHHHGHRRSPSAGC